MPNYRKPKPRTVPTTLRELVRDLDDRLEDGDALSDVWLPHEEWTALVEQADEEMLDAARDRGAAARAVNSPKRGPDADELSEERRIDLAEALDVGEDTDWADLVEVARGYAMALAAERASILQQGEDIAQARVERVPVAPPPPEGGYAVKVGSLWAGWAGHLGPEAQRFVIGVAADAERIAHAYRKDAAPGAVKVVQLKTVKKATVTTPEVTVDVEPGAELEHRPSPLRCPRCLGPCPSEGKGHCTRAAGRTRYDELSKLTLDGRREMKADHPAWFCDIEVDCVLQQPHVGACQAFAALAEDYGPQAYEPEHPEHPECPTCGEADGHKPADCAMREEPEEKPKKKHRPSKKFPKGDGMLEVCTACGAERGEHAGQRCPPKQRMMIHDVEPAAEEGSAPF